MTATDDETTSLERSLLALAYRGADLAMLPTADDVIHAVVEATREMFSSDVAYFTMHDENTDEFYVRETVGFLSEAFLHDRSTVRGFGIYGWIIDHLRPFWSSDYHNDTRFRHHPMNVSSISAEGIKALGGAPAELPGRAVPAVVFVGFRRVRDFSDEEIALLVAWGRVAGAAVENALRRDIESAALEVSRSEASRLRAEASSLQRMAEVQERLAEVVTNGGTLDELVTELSELLGGEVTVLAAAEQARSGDVEIDCATVIQTAIEDSFVQGQAIFENETVVCAVRGQDQLVGSLVARLGRLATAEDARIAERGAIHAAAVMMSRERLVAASNRSMADIVIGLLRDPQHDLDSLVVQAARHGVELRESIRLVVVDVDGLAAGRALDRTGQELGSGSALVGFYNGTLVVLVDPSADDPAERLLRVLARENVTPTATTSAASVRADQLPAAFAEAQRCLRLATALGRRGQVTPQAQLAPYAAVFGRLSPDELDAYLDELIGPLIAHDEVRGTELATTLRTFLRHGESVKATADELFIHPNTVRQRMTTVAAVLPILADAERHLDVHLALRLHDLRRA